MEKLDKAQLKKELEIAYAATINWVNEQPIENLNKEITPEKWPISHHLYHLVKSTRAVNQGMKMPKLAMRAMFGKCNRPERTQEALAQKYKAVLAQDGVKAPAKFSAEPNRTFEKDEIIQKFQTSLDELIASLDKWDEQKMSEYVLPHPAIGKCTIREMMYFTINHTYHHLDIMKVLNK